MGLQERRWEGVECIDLTEKREKTGAFVNTVMLRKVGGGTVS